MSTSLPDLESIGETAAAWKQEVNERLAAHRTRRTRSGDEHPTLPGLEVQGSRPIKSSIAAKVAARYAKAPTYSEMLAAEAQNAATAAAAAAKAANQAQAAAQAILTGLDIREDSRDGRDAQGRAGDSWRGPDSRSDVRESTAQHARETRTGYEPQRRREPWQDAVAIAPSTDQQERLTPATDSTRHESFRVASAQPGAGEASAPAMNGIRITLADTAVEDEESYEESAGYEAPQPLPANLIEFPRELVATRRARPRLAEGPMRQDDGSESSHSQLRIFEVEAESISIMPEVAHTRTEWSSIRLGAQPAEQAQSQAESRREAKHGQRQDSPMRAEAPPQQLARKELPLQTACLEDRAMAGVVDFALVTAAFLSFVLVFAASCAHLPTGRPAVILMAVSYAVIALAYQLLFFGYAESTPGMRYAKIALCTFDDENPTRKAMRVRVAAMLLSVCPLGLGCAWVFFDEDHLSWHDRITRSYQRSYR